MFSQECTFDDGLDSRSKLLSALLAHRHAGPLVRCLSACLFRFLLAAPARHHAVSPLDHRRQNRPAFSSLVESFPSCPCSSCSSSPSHCPCTWDRIGGSWFDNFSQVRLYNRSRTAISMRRPEDLRVPVVQLGAGNATLLVRHSRFGVFHKCHLLLISAALVSCSLIIPGWMLNDR